MQHIALEHDTDWAGFTRAARWAVHAGLAPQALSLATRTGTGSSAGLFDGDATVAAASLPDTAALRLPGALVALLQRATLHREPQRFDLTYRLLWRLSQPALRPQALDPLDADRRRLDLLAKAVQRDMHKAKAFVRFRPCAEAMPSARATTHPTADPEAQVQQVAWFEPEHHVLMAVAPFFARRFANLRWAILTPDMSVRWDGHELHPGPPARREHAPGPDAGEALWLAYYASIFNPARTKPAMMKKEMPVRYWRNLPEAVLIAPLLAGAAERTGRMLAQTTPVQRQRRKGQGGGRPG